MLLAGDDRRRFVDAALVGVFAISIAVASVLALSSCGDVSAATPKSEPKVVPPFDMRWNDRLVDVVGKAGALPGVREGEVAISFACRKGKAEAGPRPFRPGDPASFAAAVSFLVTEHLASHPTKTVNWEPSCIHEFIDRDGIRREFPDADLRVMFRSPSFAEVPVVFTARFGTHPGIGLGPDNQFPVQGTRFVLSTVLVGTSMASGGAKGDRANFVIEVARRNEGVRREGDRWLDARGVSVSVSVSSSDREPTFVIHDSEKWWMDGLDKAYAVHLETISGGRSCRCHARPRSADGWI